ncbi:hypothetical protein T492DRAFT_1084190 [Pavlovales sp. CCMP2436]|nr:hypothetical protein T492DRAFT_1084190 [Pavlovales sp. CCMP2436]|mmetsp:Transcript_33834/g.78121  ORF Transcript_33834/g.78121 Transcript_33834/m.78121 type:complete len:359 (+) Transcript_33834:129-1205(+)
MMLAACLCLAAASVFSPSPVVRVIARRIIRAAPPDALGAFWERTWLRGGALPFPAPRLDAYGVPESRLGSTRTLWPGITERVDAVEASASHACARFTVIESGILFGGACLAHCGEVSFARGEGAAGLPGEVPAATCELTWTISYSPPASTALWQRVTELAVGAMCDDLVSHVERRQGELTLTVCTELRASPRAAWREWLRHVWREGGGLRVGPVPLPRPIPLPSPAGARLVLPPGLQERVLDLDERALVVRYTVLNPGWLVVFPVSEHFGAVTFEPAGDDLLDPEACVMNWRVRLRPLRFGRVLSKFVTETVVVALAEGLAHELIMKASAGSESESDSSAPRLHARASRVAWTSDVRG